MSLSKALARLGVRRLLLAIHDTSFPSDPDEDLGRGSPATRAASRLFAYASALGFTGIQFGPQGQTSRDNPSPYDATIFSRHVGNIAPDAYRSGGAFAGLLDEDEIVAALVPDHDGPAQHAHAYAASHRLVAVAHAALVGGARPDLRTRLVEFRAQHASWLERDALYEAVSGAHGGAGFRAWPGDVDLDPRSHAHAMERYAFGQLLAHDEHARIRAELAGRGLAGYGDLQVGYSDRDAWANDAVFLPRYRMGAPPSRTNPEGQPWGYPVLDPDQLEAAAGALVAARADKAFAEYDSMRFDHPHGLVCPWVYPADTGDDGAAVRSGARLYESPDRPDLARYAIARPDQLDRTVPRHADEWVTGLDAAQIDRYARLFEMLVASARRHGRDPRDLSCEVLSTMPRPLAEVIARFDLGRWRITQKANLDDPSDVYRSESAGPRDWVMIGNHDTAPIFALISAWPAAKRDAWARHLAARLHLATPARLAEPGFLATCMIAELFVSRAENVSIFFADLFGYEERFNVPGLVDTANWSLRLPADFEALHARRLARGAAIDLALAAELALAAQEHGAERR